MADAAAFTRFDVWLKGYLAGDAAQRAALAEAGPALARARRAALADLIRRDPEQALARAVSRTARQRLPQDVEELLEKPVEGVGEYLVAVYCPLPGQTGPDRMTREVLIDAQRYDAFVYGRRTGFPCRRELPVHGIAVDDRLAVSERPGRLLEADEFKTWRGRRGASSICAACGQEVPKGTAGAGLALGGQTFLLCGPEHAELARERLLRVEASLPPGVAYPDNYAEILSSDTPPTLESTYTEGTKKLIIMRVDFPDYTGERVSYATLSNLVNSMNTFWRDMSYDKTGWSPVGGGSDVTPTMRLPLDSSNYESLGSLRSAARTAATAAGYTLGNYQFDMVVTASKPDAGFAGVAYVGGPGCWIANGYWQNGVCSHEVGHNFGLGHANFWNASETGSVIGPGTSEGYGDIFDTMGMAYSGTKQHFHSKYKNYLNWVTSSGVKTVTASGTNRLYRHDHGDATNGYRGLKVTRTSGNHYWVDFRQLWTANRWAMSGVILHRVGDSGGNTDLLDTTPDTENGKDDSPIVLGRTYSDRTYNIHITPVYKYSTFPEYMDVVVNLGAFAGNHAPTCAVSASSTSVAVNTTISLTATAGDSDGDPMAYYWDFGDETFGGNSTSTSHKWSSTGEYVVRCTATDMKGLQASDSVVIRVGSPSTYRITGTVLLDGAGEEGVRVAVSSTQYAYTDSDGTYSLVGLAAGSYTVSAAKEGHTFARSGFSNPVAVGPTKTNINFVGGIPSIGSIVDHVVNMSQNTGPIPFLATDRETAAGSLTLIGSSSNTNLVPDSRITFGGSGSNRTVTVSPLSGQFGSATITVTVTDGDDNTIADTFKVTVNAPPVGTGSNVVLNAGGTVDVDLWRLATDSGTTDSNLLFAVTGAVHGTVSLLADGHTARFQPDAGYAGAASFAYTVTDKGYHPSLLFYYDFEPSDTPSDGKASDRSGQARDGTLEDLGAGTYSYSTNVFPAALGPNDLVSLRLVENGTNNAARLYRSITTSEFDFRNADWTFAGWIRRDSTNSEDFVFHVGEGDGFGGGDELQLYCPASPKDVVRLANWTDSTNTMLLTSPATVTSGTWHHVAVVYDRTNSLVGNFTLYLDGVVAGTDSGVVLGLSQDFPIVLGGHANVDALTDRWFDGRLDDLAVWKTALSAAQVASLTNRTVAHFGGLSTSVTVAVTVLANEPVLSEFAHRVTNEDTPSPAIPFTIGDAQTPVSNLTVTASSSNPALVPGSNIVLGVATNPWKSVDLGAVTAAGASLPGDVFTLYASGADIWGTADEGHLLYQPMAGDGEMVARVTSVQPIDPWSKAGVMMRANTNAGSVHCFMLVSASNGVSFQRRLTNDAASLSSQITGIRAPCWVRLARSGTNIAAYYASDNAGVPGSWNQVGPTTGIDLGASPLRGLAGTSHKDGVLCTSTFDRVSGPANVGGNRTVTLMPAPNASGTATVSLIVSDGSFATTQTFDLVVTAVNDAPTIGNVTNRTIDEDTTTGAIPFPVGDVETAAAALTVTGASSNISLVPNTNIVIGGSGSNRTVTVTPAPNQTGAATLTLTVSDGALTNVDSFVLTVAPVNDAPVLAVVSNRTLGAGQILTVTNAATDVDLPAQTLTFSLLANPTGAALGAASGVLTWRPAVAQADSTNLFRVRVADNGSPILSATQQFSAVVRPLAPASVAEGLFTNSQFRLSIAGDSGPDYTVQASTNLADWSYLFTSNAPTPPFYWTDPASGGFLRRFYRVLLGP